MLKIADKVFNSHLFVGTGKFSSSELMREALDESGSEVVTVALRRVDASDKSNDNILSYIDENRFLVLPNTSGARNAEEAVRIAKLARAAGGYDWIKLEIHPNPNHLLPDPIETLKAAEILVKDGFKVMPYINADPVLAKRLEDIGTVSVMPLAAPIGTNKGVVVEEMIKIIIDNANVPVVIDAGIGKPSHAAYAIELGADAVLVNTAIAVAQNPAKMAKAFKKAVESALLAREGGMPDEKDVASASSPLTGFLWE